jgi:hypothetical protein
VSAKAVDVAGVLYETVAPQAVQPSRYRTACTPDPTCGTRTPSRGKRRLPWLAAWASRKGSAMNRNWIGQLAGVAVALVVTACATNTAAVGHSPATAPGCPATLSVQAPPRSGQAQTGQPQPGPALVRQGASVATICQYATALPASKAAATPLRRLVMRGAAAAGLAAVLDNAGPLSGHAARCDRNAGRLPFSQLIRFGYPDGPGELAVITYTSCSLAVVTAGTRAGALTGPVQDDLFYYTTITRQDRGPRTPDLIGSTAATAQSSARRHGFGLGVDGEALDPAAAFGTIIFQVPPPSAVDSGPGSPSVGVIVAVPPTPACQPGHLRLDYRAGGPGAGNDFGTIIVRDVAGTPCRLAGQLRVTGVGPAGRPVTNTVTGSITGPGVLSPDAARVKGHRDFPVGGQLISLRVDRLCPWSRSADLPAGQVSGVTPFPAVASARRRLVPSVRTRCA